MLGNWLGLVSKAFRSTTVTNIFLKSDICNTLYNEINTLCVTFNDKELEYFKVRPTHSILNGMENG